MTPEVLDVALQDLAGLALPPGLSKDEFTTEVGERLRQLPLVQRIADSAVFRDLEKDFVAAAETRGDVASPREFWDALSRWLGCFLPEEFYVQPVKEHRIVRGKKLVD